MSVVLPTKQVLVGYSASRGKAFAQGVTDEGLLTPSDLWLKEWPDYNYRMTVCQAGQRTFIVASGSSSDPHWPGHTLFIQEILPNGLLGDVTFQGKSDMAFTVMCPYMANGRTFIYFHSPSRCWFISELLENGQLGSRIAQGQFNNYYPIGCTVTVNGVNYVFGSRPDGYWFLQELLSDGHLGAEHDNGSDSGNNRLISVCSIAIDDVTLLMGQREDNSFVVWKMEQDWEGAKYRARRRSLVTRQTGWNRYRTFTAFQTAKGPFFFGQGSEKWFIAPIFANGGIGGETASGKWANVYDDIAVAPTPVPVNPDRWMTDRREQIVNRMLKQLVMPGSHDAGLYRVTRSYTGSPDSLAITQRLSIQGQLEAGSRYFDIRLVKETPGFTNLTIDDLWIQHLTYKHGEAALGSRGPKLVEVLDDIIAFVSKPERQELVIVNVSHTLYLDQVTDPNGMPLGILGQLKTTPDQIHKIAQVVSGYPKLSGWLVKTAERPGGLQFGALVKDKSAVLLVFDDLDFNGRAPIAGAYSYAKCWSGERVPSAGLTVYDHAANSYKLSAMEADQRAELVKPGAHDGDMFLLSWTLTEDWGSILGLQSILDLADLANDRLPGFLNDWFRENPWSPDYPNIVFADAMHQAIGSAVIGFLDRILQRGDPPR